MELKEYKQFIALQDRLECLAAEFFQVVKLNDKFYSEYDFKDVHFNNETACINIEWYGSYQSHDLSSYSVPASIFLNADLWVQFITNERERRNLEMAKEAKRIEKESRERQVAHAKEILRQYGETVN